ncbi:hypothetical protein ES703_14225 [subsurface metagenome]
MDLKETIKVNKQIMALIKSKYNGEFPTGYTGPDYRYYECLERDIKQAERYLEVYAAK